jgi:hypothetical protein
MEITLTRRQFGLGLLGALGSLLLWGFLSRLGFGGGRPAEHGAPARFWRRGEELAG